jgi:hypothetical protein
MLDLDDEYVGWKPLRVVELQTLLPGAAAADTRMYPSLIGIAPGTDGSDTIFLGTHYGVFAINLKSRWIRKVSEDPSRDYAIFPYTSFVTPGIITSLSSSICD